MGVVMMTGIMAIFEMGLSLTGQSFLQSPQNKYHSNPEMKAQDRRILRKLAAKDVFLSGGKTLPDLVSDEGLCSALYYIGEGNWSPTDSNKVNDYFSGSCVLNRQGGYRSVVRENGVGQEVSYQLFLCVLGDGESVCSFEKRRGDEVL